jgi:hypothetical protein
MIFLDKLCEQLPQARQLVEGCRCLRVHNDVIALGGGIIHDEHKLKAAAPYIFLPAVDTWIEWEDETGAIGMFFGGAGDSVTMGRGFFAVQHHRDPSDQGDMILFNYDLETYQMNHLPHPEMDMSDRLIHAQATSQLKPIIFAVLALINSPKIIRTRERSTSISPQQEAGCLWDATRSIPHHEVQAERGQACSINDRDRARSDGASKCLHFVSTHLRLRSDTQGGYTLVHPHWRGDPALGIRDTLLCRPAELAVAGMSDPLFRFKPWTQPRHGAISRGLKMTIFGVKLGVALSSGVQSGWRRGSQGGHGRRQVRAFQRRPALPALQARLRASQASSTARRTITSCGCS